MAAILSSSTRGVRPVRTALDGALVFGVLVLAFLLGTAPARNSDVWLHLATGRALAQGCSVFP